MDRDFIARNQVVERYLSGRLPLKGATEFERFCRAHGELLDELGLPERVNAGLRLIVAGGLSPENVAELFSEPDVDGALVGGASLQVETFAAICEIAATAAAVR